ncbi:hypothetical protein SAMN05661008_01245 [Alkalithermobacter thermoalcaliphilus JW-YL-7 = DSM 7308]|uniref:YIEGIA protein n=1 Tax=Alkalithermobacter thermoalcaliphilus JW-YL-7 = DSM 7308 TaxID=1121328 RepID=A0A150FQT3_CLOPD|nr:YIEGIA protein [[Clostridium] paradoxum JW-YL-7 = DSM 7308]SHK97808.1 hypothetical protein SAMN05661008_01245 [[Clostridium] paradoxum JW-YL-7 = DSM 7308]
MHDYVYLMTTSFIVGFFSRLYMMRLDNRQYPTYPQGFISHITLGIIASALGSVAIPALVEKEFSAVTFLALAAQQFRDVRSMERQSLDNIESTEMVPRGTAYIEDIAKAFEARNYMAILSALSSGISFYVVDNFLKAPLYICILIALIVGTLVAFALKNLLTREKIGEIADVVPAKIEFDGPFLKINGVTIMNVGLESSRERYINEGLAVEIIPKENVYIGTISNLGQRQVIAHNISIQLGIKKDVDEPDFTPMIRRNPNNESLLVSIVPIKKDESLLIELIKNIPVIESAKGKSRYLKG